jgi:predicted nucleic acid-binding protein
LSAAADDDPAVIAILARAGQMAIPVIVLGEYRYGIAQSRHRTTYENWLASLLRDCAVLDINEPTTQQYAEITLELRRKGKPIPTNDLWIAALCRQHSLPLLSRDRHFDQVPGLKRIGW